MAGATREGMPKDDIEVNAQINEARQIGYTVGLPESGARPVDELVPVMSSLIAGQVVMPVQLDSNTGVA
eukprot:6549014-Alexandrium_andersonii.AAC.1